VLTTNNATVFFGSIPIWDFEQSGNFGRQRSRATWTFHCRYSDFPTLMFYMLGGAAIISGVVTIAEPFVHPKFPWMYAWDISFKHQIGHSGLFQSNLLMVETDYYEITVTFNAEATDTGEEGVDIGYESIPVPGGTFSWWAGSGSPSGVPSGGNTNWTALSTGESPFQVVPSGLFRRTINRTAILPSATILSLVGCVNNATFLGASGGQILYLGCSSTREFTTQGAKNWNLTHQFKFKYPSWQKFLTAAAGVVATNWVNIYDNFGNPPYPSGDLTQLGVYA
jgi:hypothetical protein